MTKILISTTSFGKDDPYVLDAIKNKGYEIVLNHYGRKLTKEESVKLLSGVQGLIAGTETLDKEVLEKAASLKVISRCGVGIDNVDIKYAHEKGIKVLNTPDAPTLAVAELTIGLILNMLRKTSLMDRAVRNNKWDKKTGNLLNGKKVGVVGFGRIGRKVAELLLPFNCEIMYYDPYVNDVKTGKKAEKLEDLLKWSDIITVHISSSQRIIGEKELGLMPEGSWLVNVSRGGTVDETALFNALKSGHLAGAGLDVFEKEPYAGPLKDLENVVLTPHIGSYAKESRIEMERQSVINLLNGLEGKK